MEVVTNSEAKMILMRMCAANLMKLAPAESLDQSGLLQMDSSGAVWYLSLNSHPLKVLEGNSADFKLPQ